MDIHLAKEYEPKIFSNRISYRPYNALLLVLGGEYRYTTTEGVGFTVHKGDVLYLPAGMPPYSYEIKTNNQPLRTLQIEFSMKREGEDLRFSQHPVVITGFDLFEVKNAMLSIVAGCNSDQPSSKLETVSCFYRLLSLLQRAVESDESRTVKKILPAVRFIEEHYGEKISAAYLADLCYLSTSQLRRNFNAAFGMSPLEYKKQLVLKMAKKMLKAQTFSVSEVSEMLGFNDIYEFSHFFKKMTGVSPRQYQSKCDMLN